MINKYTNERLNALSRLKWLKIETLVYYILYENTWSF